MTVERADQDKVSKWAAECRDYTRDVLEQLGQPADLMQTDPGAAACLLDEGLAQESPALLTKEELVRLQTLLMAFLAEFLISVHGAHWTRIGDTASPGGGHWAISGLTHPLGQQAAPVDVAGLVGSVLATASTISLTALINQAEHAAGIRIIRGRMP